MTIVRVKRGLRPFSNLSIGSPSQNEGDSGSANMGFPVQVVPLPYGLKFYYATRDGTAQVAGSDYSPTSGSATIIAGQTSATVNVGVLGDTNVEPDESFFLDVTSMAYV